MKQILNLSLMMLTIITILISLPFAISEFTNTPVYIHPEFEKTFNEFREDAKKYKVNLNLSKLITIFSHKVEDGTAAFCIPKTNTIVVSSSIWSTLNDNARKALLYHEWGHCILKREHVELYSFAPLQCPISIMYPYIDPMNLCYNKDNQESYNRELFTNPYGFETFSRRKK